MDLSKYYAKIMETPLLTKDEEEELFKKHRKTSTSVKDKNIIREKVIKANMRFAFNQAKIFSKNDPSIFGDLISAANEGLIVGFDKFDPDSGVRYLSYAGWWVKQRILKEMSKMRIVSLPIWKQQLASRIQRILDNNEKITLVELKAEFEGSGVKEKDIEELYKTRYLTYYIDDLEENEFEVNPIEDEINRRLDNDKIWASVNELTSPHREVIARCFGLEDTEEHSVSSIAKALKMPKAEIQRIKNEGLEQLREKMQKHR